MLRLYNIALAPLLPLAEVLARAGRRRGTEEWSQRRGLRLPRVAPGGLWLHGASLGEAGIVAALASSVREKHPGLPLVVSAVTATGRARLPSPPAVDAAFFAPLDFPRYVRRALSAVRPRALVLVETELWPNLVGEADASGVRVVVVNGRLSARRARRYRLWRGLYRSVAPRIARVGARTVEDAARFEDLGVERTRIAVTGDVKYDVPPPGIDPETLRRRFGIDPGRAIWVAGSTAEGEDAIVLDAHRALRERWPDLLLVLVPRHPERAAAVERLARERGSVVCASSGVPVGSAGVLLVDRVGELAALYRLARVAFVGGTLVPRGGHNVLEPAVAGTPLVIGPHFETVAEAVEGLHAARALRTAAGLRELVDGIGAWLADPDERDAAGARAAAVVDAHRGALARSIAIVEDVLHDGRGQGVA